MTLHRVFFHSYHRHSCFHPTNAVENVATRKQPVYCSLQGLYEQVVFELAWHPVHTSRCPLRRVNHFLISIKSAVILMWSLREQRAWLSVWAALWLMNRWATTTQPPKQWWIHRHVSLFSVFHLFCTWLGPVSLLVKWSNTRFKLVGVWRRLQETFI